MREKRPEGWDIGTNQQANGEEAEEARGSVTLAEGKAGTLQAEQGLAFSLDLRGCGQGTIKK